MLEAILGKKDAPASDPVLVARIARLEAAMHTLIHCLSDITPTRAHMRDAYGNAPVAFRPFLTITRADGFVVQVGVGDK